MWALVYVLLGQRLTSFPDVSVCVQTCACARTCSGEKGGGGEKNKKKGMQGSMCAVFRSLLCPTAPPELHVSDQ